ncbi:hypothetical protein ATKI12_8862 [Kitasatospora sp. Ki12]
MVDAGGVGLAVDAATFPHSGGDAPDDLDDSDAGDAGFGLFNAAEEAQQWVTPTNRQPAAQAGTATPTTWEERRRFVDRNDPHRPLPRGPGAALPSGWPTTPGSSSYAPRPSTRSPPVCAPSHCSGATRTAPPVPD